MRTSNTLTRTEGVRSEVLQRLTCMTALAWQKEATCLICACQDGLGVIVEDVLQRISEPDPMHGCAVVLSSDSLAQLQKCLSVQHLQPMRE